MRIDSQLTNVNPLLSINFTDVLEKTVTKVALAALALLSLAFAVYQLHKYYKFTLTSEKPVEEKKLPIEEEKPLESPIPVEEEPKENLLNGPGEKIVDGIKYSGFFKDNELHGIGMVIYPDDRIIEANFERGQMVDNQGTIKYPSGSIFKGKIKDGLPIEGEGTVFEKSVFTGTYKDGKCHYGKLVKPNGDYYEGFFDENGELSGVPCSKMVDGVLYTGKFKNNQLQEYGEVKYPDGKISKGYFEDDELLNGEGLLIAKIKQTYSGQVKEGLAEGTGILEDDTLKLEGEFVDGVFKSGTGKMKLPTGIEYTGKWENYDFVEGTVTFQDGFWLKGKFLLGVLLQGHGRIKMKGKRGWIYEGPIRTHLANGDEGTATTPTGDKYKGAFNSGYVNTNYYDPNGWEWTPNRNTTQRDQYKNKLCEYVG